VQSWGCGGHMRPEYYSDLYLRFNTYVRNYDKSKMIYRIACGPNAEDYDWTDKVMELAHGKIDGISLHYYTDIWDCETRKKKSATEFTTEQYYQILAQAYKIDEIITRHIERMNRHDYKHRVDLIVDEWGTWFDVEPGTNPGFLYQQNTMRDAIVAGLTLNIFNKHSDRIRMANIAQTVNVLQAVALTEGNKMVLTPTYYVFKMFKEHQNNSLLGSFITSDVDKIYSRKHPTDDANLKLPQLIESASVNENGTIYSTIVNTSATKSAKIKCQIADTKISLIKAEILTGDIHDKNDFNNKDVVKIVEFTDFRKLKDGFTATLPACSIVKFTIER
jgi:alpha-N-arabinofuranosidase